MARHTPGWQSTAGTRSNLLFSRACTDYQGEMNPAAGDDPFDLNRFLQAQEPIYATALNELRAGEKRTHWMWFIFPQMAGLGFSSTARFYSIRSRNEAVAFLKHPVLGPRLCECAQAILGVRGRSAREILGYPDDLKLQSCATLFSQVAAPDSVFSRILAGFYGGKADDRTLELLAER